METTELHDGYNIPNLFYGTYKVFDELLPCLDAALGAGYRGIGRRVMGSDLLIAFALDTAAYYHNERRIGEALKLLMPKYNLHRRDLFLSTKLPPKSYGSSAALHAFRVSQEALEAAYIDLYMIHWPGLQGLNAAAKAKDGRGYMAELRRQSWQAMETLVLESEEAAQQLVETQQSPVSIIKGSGPYRCVRSLGVCNYLPRHVQELASYATVPPAVVQKPKPTVRTFCPISPLFTTQYEFHPYLSVEAQEHPMRRMCTRLFPMQPVHFQAHTVFAGGSPDLLNSRVIQKAANELQKTPAQIIIRWSLQKGHSVIATSTKPRHIIENSRVFGWTLDQPIISRIDAMERNERFCWDPHAIP
ncbi:hypothetical protein PHET_04944 [Paragonimus heterotremus]|uniref:NADP-dependent oxidoreductase domain-containing protein n=1 Tax=Paragonimus heterotremus TaxID=100268 RepID=A0A8J4WGX6_9TREM|nr:hypothetical protein PHET_04944 [Paragonimus heterotremus]